MRQDLAYWQVHDTEDDCDLIIRSNSGHVFYCHICPSQFVRSPAITEQYFKCLELLRTGEVEIDDFYEEDAHEWLLNCFEPLIARLAPSSELQVVTQPTLAHYYFPEQTFVCHLKAVDDKLQPEQLDTKNHGWSSPIVKFDSDFLTELNQWTQSYTPSQVQVCYDRTEDSLIKPPTCINITNQDGQPLKCFFKKFGLSFGPSHAKNELLVLKKITESQIPPPPQAYICRLVGVVRKGNGLLGMLLSWIDKKSVLSKTKASASSPELRKRWTTQIRNSLDSLHENDIIWGDVKGENVLIDQNDDAWIIDFGGSYTMGWVDEDKTGTLEGDEQGVAKILELLE
ncbi:hypothetical protein BFJ68_g15282 [Fusarium oxysporum]|uniref:Uncharacterized protein n=1 Tax=Fusarium oxysporum TaxID=5507 RepID=A0A420NV59_FUSOX|nr:hypothetical protein BFJ71_g14660 [Fusarium oxysporum]RKK94125.1 hypothetical protein BFJ68_g15282 [Fusarium oxysporum]